METFSDRLFKIEDKFYSECEALKEEIVNYLFSFFEESGCEYLKYGRSCSEITIYPSKETEGEILYSFRDSKEPCSLLYEDTEFLVEIIDYLIENKLIK